MAWAVFLRGVNVGKTKRLETGALARALAALDVTSIGAAGTFVVRKSVAEPALRAAFAQALPFECELMACREREIVALGDDPFPRGSTADGVARYVTVLAKRAPGAPKLPIVVPDGAAWQVKVVALDGRFALSLHRRQGKTLIYPNEVIEKRLGVPATTRNWNTIEKIRARLDA